MIRSALVLFSVIGLSACSVIQTGSKSNVPQTYSEDLSALRPKFAEEGTVQVDQGKSQETVSDRQSFVRPQFDVTSRINAVVDTLSARNRAGGYLEGYSVQVITTRSRQEATDIRNKVLAQFDYLRPEIVYEQPNYKVKIGFFPERFEAYEVFALLPKQDFPLTLIVPERRPIRNE